MKIVETPIKDLLIIEPTVYEDQRGYFFESYNKNRFNGSSLGTEWVQDNESKSTRGILRGLHYQVGTYAQAKLVRAVTGEIFDVAVDLRTSSKTFGQWYGLELNETNKLQLLIPRGFAHGFVVLSDEAIFAYKCDNFYSQINEGGIIFNDPTLNIEWPIEKEAIIVSEKDKLLPLFQEHKAL